MPVIEITSLEHPGVDVFGTLTEAQLRNRIDPERGIFIAESPKVIRVALDAGYQPLALLCEKKHIEGDAADIILRAGDIPVYTGSRELLASLTGYTLTRGVLCAMRRPAPRTPEEVCRDARRVAVIHGVVDTTNIGAIFRSAAALGIDAILLSPDSCDPLNRRAVRVSMGSVFLVPWTWLPRPVSSLREMGFCTACFDRPFRSHRLSGAQGNSPFGYCDGYRRRRPSSRSAVRVRLCSPHTDVAWCRLTECSGSLSCSLLGATGTPVKNKGRFTTPLFCIT